MQNREAAEIRTTTEYATVRTVVALAVTARVYYNIRVRHAVYMVAAWSAAVSEVRPVCS